MKRLSSSQALCALALLLLSLWGCGDDSSSPVPLSGVVEDGPVGASTISLYDKANAPLFLCGPQGTARCETTTNADGAFSLTMKAGTSVADLGAVSVGVDFIGPELKTPLDHFANNLQNVVISPLTTLIAELRLQGLSLPVAQERLREWLLLPAATNLSTRPSLSPEVKRTDLLLSKVALEINVKNPDAQPFVLIAVQISNSTTRFFAEDAISCNSEVMTALGLDANAQKRIELLIGTQPLYHVASPQLLSELPGSDNEQHLAYFYGSDLSPHFRAEQLMWRVFDDKINDEVLLKIAEGKANAGLIDETKKIIDKMQQSDQRAHAYRALGNALITYKRMDEARSALDLARELYLQVIASKGVASASSTDFDNLISTSNSYRKAGDLLNAQNLLVEVSEILASNLTNYGRLISGLKKLVDAYIVAGDLDAAALQTGTMYNYSGQTPATVPGNYMLRVQNLGECAKRYAALNNQEMVLQIFTEIQLLRETNPTTKTVTWVYMPDLAETLYRVGETAKALELANSIPSTSMSGPNSNRSAAFKKIAVYEALSGDLATAISLADNLTIDAEKVELLTYYASNREVPYIALSLINAGRDDEARQALVKAEELLVGAGMIQSTNLEKIRYGYVKVAELYALMGDSDKAKTLLDSAQTVIAADIYRVAAMVDIALGYYNLNQRDSALTIFSTAQSLAESDQANQYRADLPPAFPIVMGAEETKTLLYEKFIKAYEQMGEKSLERSAVQLFLAWAEKIHMAGSVNDALASKECDLLLRAALYLDRSDNHEEALAVIASAKESAAEIAIVAKRLTKYLSVINTYAGVHEYVQGLIFSLSLPYTSERNLAIQSLANATIERDDFPVSAVASIDSDGDGQPDFFHPLATADEIAASGLSQDADSDGDGIADTLDLHPLFAD